MQDGNIDFGNISGRQFTFGGQLVFLDYLGINFFLGNHFPEIGPGVELPYILRRRRKNHSPGGRKDLDLKDIELFRLLGNLRAHVCWKAFRQGVTRIIEHTFGKMVGDAKGFIFGVPHQLIHELWQNEKGL